MKILLATPPLTQLNTPYPATVYLTGYLRRHGFNTAQADLGIELVNRLFSSSKLKNIFQNTPNKLSVNAQKIKSNQQQYINTVDAVLRFLQGKDPALATRICNTEFLPRASRFNLETDLEWAFGTMGFSDQAKYLATMYIEDLTDYIHEAISPNFLLNRYAEHLCQYAPDFKVLGQNLQTSLDLVDETLIEILAEKLTQHQPTVVGFTIPFPGNLYGALRCGQYIKKRHPDITVVFGGGYITTELRQLSTPEIFNYVDYLLYDDGEPALIKLFAFFNKEITNRDLHKTAFKDETGNVQITGFQSDFVIPFKDTAWPDYTDLPLDMYLSMIEITNPMHKLWGDGRWNKLTLAHGCYWGKCAFCDTTLPYIAHYESLTAETIADRMESCIRQTGQSGFHFVDEAAPPKLLRELSLEILKRKMVVSWWTNIRFEKTFSQELCELMARAGCIAVSGGMEVASNKLLKLINKGVTVEQASLTAANFTECGIMVHAYLMYGFPAQNVSETIDALETIRQLFEEGLIQSAFWHRYAMTIHSPSGITPSQFGAQCLYSHHNSFANNEIPFTDGSDIDLDSLGEGLRKATFNYMHGLGFDMPLQKWFNRKVPKSKVAPSYIRALLAQNGW